MSVRNHVRARKEVQVLGLIWKVMSEDACGKMWWSAYDEAVGYIVDLGLIAAGWTPLCAGARKCSGFWKFYMQ